MNNLLSNFRDSNLGRGIAALSALCLINQVVAPTVALALTSGPKLPETLSFEPVTTTQMVDPFTGDFNYNIPLFNLPGPDGGYPFNLAYHSGVSMDQEASWVGLGWNLTAGSINKNIRGIPDDFNGEDQVEVTQDMKPNHTFGLSTSLQYELAGADLKKLTLSPSLQVYYNNYRGIGYNAGLGLGIGTGYAAEGLGLNLSLDSQEGASAGASLSLGHNKTQKHNEFSFGLSFGTASGLALSHGVKRAIDMKHTVGESNFEGIYAGSGANATYSFFANNYSPSTPMPMRTKSLSVSLKFGSEAPLQATGWGLSGFYNVQNLKDRGTPKLFDAYGYENLKSLSEDDSESSMMDFQREKNGIITKNSPNLASTSLSNDIYQVQGQGTGGHYRSFRNDIGNVHDPLVISNTAGGGVSLDINVPAGGAKAANGGTVTMGRAFSGKWRNDKSENSWESQYLFRNKATFGDYNEQVYQKMHGEHTSFKSSEMDYIGGEEPIAALLEKIPGTAKKYRPNSTLWRVGTDTETASIPADKYRTSDERVSRNTSIQHIKNEQISKFSGSGDALGEYEIKYHTNQNFESSYTSPIGTLDRTIHGHHTGAITTLGPDGMRYNYALPVYNNKQIEVQFSTDPEMVAHCEPTVDFDVVDDHPKYEWSGVAQKSDDYFNKTETPAYVSSYLMTSVLGTDYVDSDNIPGPSDGDMGYFVKFDYQKFADDYNWRGPYRGANYIEGSIASKADDKGAYTYGEKQVYYLATAETKTHIAIFHTSNRSDSKEAKGEMARGTDVGTRSALQLDKVSIYLKSEWANPPAGGAKPIQEWIFEYDYSLCNGALNSSSGKLTLKKLYSVDYGSERGRLSPYKFSYGAYTNLNTGLTAISNPNYGENNYDRWGNYKPDVTDGCVNRELSYVEQLTQDLYEDADQNNEVDNDIAWSQREFQTAKNEYASAWLLTEVQMPTGGTMKVEYESDDYAYVQHKTATQMVKIAQVNDQSSGANILYEKKDGTGYDQFDINDPRQRRVYFDLENPIIASSASDNSYDPSIDGVVYDQYVKELIKDEDGETQMYFKIKVGLRMELPDNEYVSGYCPIEADLSTVNTHMFESVNYKLLGVDVNSLKTITIDGGTPVQAYTRGFVTLKQMQDHKGNLLKFHPMAISAWQFMRTNMPEMLLMVGNTTKAPNNASNAVKAQKVKELVSWIPAIKQTFSDYRNYCKNHEFGRSLDLSKSVVRLCSPDKKKYGGGSRVKKISFSDNWDQITDNGTNSENAHEYGQVYQYTTTDENGVEISSGVAQYEPMIGGDEIALRYPKAFPQKVPFKTANNLFFEHPVNEHLYPGPAVGYSKVTVKSIATEKAINGLMPNSIATSGVSQLEYYTARDYPVIVEETQIQNLPLNLPIPIPFIGQYTQRAITASQGYTIKLNNMHGQMKSQKEFALDDSYDLVEIPITSVQYFYKDHAKEIGNKDDKTLVRELDNQVNVLIDHVDENSPSNALIEEKIMGVEYDFVTDQKHDRNWSITAGLDFNLEIPVLGIVPTVWPTYVHNIQNLKTITTNKVIHKSGLLVRMEATDGGSHAETQNLVYDKETGKPVVSSVTNNYNRPIYNYNFPGHYEYEGMGAAYKNWGVEVDIPSMASFGNNLYGSTQVPASLGNHLVPGDEFIVTSGNTNFRATYQGVDESTSSHVFYSENLDLSNGDHTYFLYRSGARNMLDLLIGELVTIGDLPPTEGRAVENCTNGEPEIPRGLDLYKLDDVLATSATKYNDAWISENNEVNIGHTKASGDVYRTGERGIWRSLVGYAYVDERKQTKIGNQPDPDLSHDGTMDNVAMFNWQRNDFTDCATKWKKANEVTHYNAFGKGTEERNVGGVYSAALYGYNGTLPTAIISNSRQDESGFDGFEEYQDGEQPSLTNLKSGNLNFYNDLSLSGISSYNEYEYYEVIDGESTYVVINKPYDPSYSVSNVLLNVNGNNSSGELRRYFKEVTGSASNFNGNTKITFTSIGNPVYQMRGTVGIEKAVNVGSIGSNSTVSISSEKAHTGKQCLKLTAVSAFNQFRLNLEENESYVFSAWISKDNTDVPFYSSSDIGVSIDYLDNSGAVISSYNPPDYFKGRKVEEWHQVYFTFTPASGTNSIRINIDPKSSALYLDDARIHPEEGNMETYVYDPETFRIKAVLNQNNYSTIYEYDEQGNLFLTKVEGARGKRVVMESRNHVVEQP